MTTHYTRIVSVDSITLVNPSLRLRQIVNYQRPPEGQPLEQVLLVGFGVEQKTD
ncbi:phycobiliprotein lyase [Oxynema aestuarii]|uniref:phycobiliprotein lyase n=1 Tax=Oxynema aestuarii TaxID=2874213 RepID=UPI001FE48973|nr:phycobiliprotein lyase [Oxynema aestuarii]